MSQVILENVTFENVPNKHLGTGVATVLTQSNIGASESTQDYLSGDSKYNIVNAVDIDWNGATLEDGDVINSTSDLIKKIDEKASVEDIPSVEGLASEAFVSGYTYDKATIDEKVASGGTFDPTMYYTKSETSGKSEISTALSLKANVSDIPTVPTEVSAFNNDAGYLTQHQSLVDYYKKNETSGKTEINTALSLKADKSEIPSLNGYATEQWVGEQGYLTEHQSLDNYYKKSETSGKSEISTALSDKLDATAYTPTDLTNYYTKSETSGATEISTALSGKANVSDIPSVEGLASEAFVSAFTYSKETIDEKVASGGTFDPSLYYKKSETSGATEISTALSDKLDATAYTPTDLTNYYTKSETSGKTEIETALSLKANASDIPTVPTSNTAFTNDAGYLTEHQSLANYYTKSETSGKTEIATALGNKQDTLSAGTNITIEGNVISATGGGGGKAIEAGRGISITTGETADTVSFNLPISAGTGSNSIIEGWNSSASGNYSHAEGQGRANGNYSHAEGLASNANGLYSHVEGGWTVANQQCSHAEGSWTMANGDFSHAEGSDTSAMTSYSHAEGLYTKALNQSEHASGQYNNSVSASTTFGDSGNTLFSVGNGTGDDARHNAFEIRQNGDIYLTKDGQDIKLQDQLGGGGSVTVDSAISSSSTNPVQNAVIYQQFGGLKLQQITQSVYDALATKDSSTLYVIVG